MLGNYCWPTKNEIMEVQGRIKEIFETKEYGRNGFQKREMVLTTEEQYPQHLKIEFVQDKTNLLDSYEKGQLVKISINLRGREWINPEGEAVYFNSINGWRIEAVQQEKNQPPQGNTPPPPNEPSFEPMDGNDDFGDDDDLPF